MSYGEEAEAVPDFGSEEDASWYFDLPSGAWERQEEKNRQLRQSVRDNISSSPAPERFGGRTRDQKPAEPASSWRLARPGEATDEPVALPSRFSFDPLADPAPPPPAPAGWQATAVPADEYESARLRSIAPPTPPPAGEEEVLGAMRAWAVRAVSEPVPNDPPAEDAAESPHEAPRIIPLRPGVLHVPEPPPPPAEGNSRWDEMFAAKAEGSGIVESMREWAQRASAPAEPREVPPEFLQPFDWETEGAAETGASVPGQAVSLQPVGWEAEGATPVAPPVLSYPAETAETKVATAFEAPWLKQEPEDDAGALPAGIDAPALEEIQDWPFAVPPFPAASPPKKGGLFGRLFGRREKQPPPSWTDIAPGEWVSDETTEPWPSSGAAASEPAGTASVAPGVMPEPASIPADGDAGPGSFLSWAPGVSGSGHVAVETPSPSGPDPEAAPDDREGFLTPAARTGPAIANNGSMPAFPEDDPPGPRPFEHAGAGEGAIDDDPWAAFLAARDEEDGEVTAPAPFEVGPEGETSPGRGWSSEVDTSVPVDPLRPPPVPADTAAAPAPGSWVDAEAGLTGRGAPYRADSRDSNDDLLGETFEPSHGAIDVGASELAPGESWRVATPDDHRAEDDPWGHVTAASGFDDGNDVPGVFRRRTGAAPRVPAADDAYPDGDASLAPGPEAWASRSESQPSSAWQGHDDDGHDVVLQAFEAHAAADEDPGLPAGPSGHLPAVPDDELDFGPLLGPGGAELMDEVSPPPMAHPSMARLQGWAPQKAALDQGWQPPALPGAGFPPPEDRWATEEELATVPPWARPPGNDDGAETPAVVAPAQPRGRTVIREVVETGLLALLVFLAVRASFQNFKVDGTSMYPTLEDGQFLIVNKLVYSEIDVDRLSKLIPFIDAGETGQRNVFHGPERGDVVVLRDPRDPSTDLIKRVIGLPGETVEIVDGVIYINDQRLEEPYITSRWHYTGPKIRVEAGKYFVMGDNRENSLDSRNGTVGQIPRDLIIGKAMLSYWPGDRFGLAPNESPRLTDEKPRLTAQRVAE